jgi:hypothetical protein
MQLEMSALGQKRTLEPVRRITGAALKSEFVRLP